MHAHRTGRPRHGTARGHSRRGVVALFADYQARITIRYVEVPESVLVSQNRQRPSPVPQEVMERLIDCWETPDRTEAHAVETVVRE